ncbi:MAG: response regulator, partial [Acidobacteria bacterium]|nr:response regulator [Acidobacteriota bacterium]
MTRALIVDDAPENLYLLRTILEAHGWQVDEARHGVEALSAAAVRLPDIIISDLLMPVMDGYALLARCRADEALARIPFVVFTATYTDPRDEKLTLELGADGFILKPQEPEELMARLGAILARGAAPATRPPPGNGEVRLAEYNEVLVRKLEQKAIEVEEANRELREAKAWLSQAVAAGRVGLWDWDLPTGTLTYSEDGRRQLGIEARETGGTFEDWKSRLHPDDAPRVLEVLESYVSSGAGDLELEFRLRHEDGTYRTL